MSDMAKVIKGLEEISDYFFGVYHHSKDREEINKAKDRCDTVEEALVLLKEQEAVEPIMVDHIVFGTNRKCSKCNMYLFPAARYCPHCGRLVKWDGMC